MTRLVQIIMVVSLVCTFTTNSFADDFTTFNVNGQKYQALIPDQNTREFFYMVHKALDGDALAREMVLGGQDKKLIYIGDFNIVRWLVITKDKEEVIEHSTGEQNG